MKKLFLIIGAPGSGKTTDAELIAANNRRSPTGSQSRSLAIKSAAQNRVRPVLGGMCGFVRQEVSARSGPRCIITGRKNDVPTDRVGPCIDGSGAPVGCRSGVNPYFRRINRRF